MSSKLTMSCLCNYLILVSCGLGIAVAENGHKRLLVEENYYELTSKLDNLTRNFNDLWNEVGILKNQHVVFVAYLSRVIRGQNHQIIFDDVRLNTANSYHAGHGNFIAPIAGMYQFTITACSYAGHFTVLELTINTTVVDKVLAGDDAYADCNTGVFFHRLTAGDDVYVQHTNQGDLLFSKEAHGRPMFTGLLLYAL